MKILFLTHRPDTPSTRYRVDPFAGKMKREGHDVRIRTYSSSLFSLWPMLRDAREADAVVLQKRLPSPWLTRALRRRARKLVYDFDDAVYMASAARDRRFAAVVSAADHVVAGNSHLADRARAGGARAVSVIPTVLDPAKYESAVPPNHEGVVAGWIGAGGNLPYLEAILPRLAGLPVRVRVVCDRFPEGVERIPWSAEGEAAAVAGMDIGLAPMPDDDWTRGKCGTRVLQYFACGLPVVADDVGVHRDLVGDGGLLVRSPEEWPKRIQELAQDASLRRRMGAAGRARLKERFTPEAAWPRWKEVLGI